VSHLPVIGPVRCNIAIMGDDIMSQSRDTLAVTQSPAETAPTALTFDERWAQWEAKGARHDVRVARNMRVLMALVLTVGVIWATAVLR
jgi:hypothetical protein